MESLNLAHKGSSHLNIEKFQNYFLTYFKTFQYNIYDIDGNSAKGRIGFEKIKNSFSKSCLIIKIQIYNIA